MARLGGDKTSQILATQELLHWTMPGAGAKARHATRVDPHTGVAFRQMAHVRQQEHVKRRLIAKEQELTHEREKLARLRSDFERYRARSLKRIAAERAEVAELDRLCVERYQRLAKWALQRQLMAINHVSMRTVKVATLFQEELEINRRMQEDRDRAIKFSQLRVVIKQLEERVSSVYDVAKEFFASEVTMRMELREDNEQMRRLADEAMCAIKHYTGSLPRVGVHDGAMQLCEYSQTMVQCAREISEAVQDLEPLECVYNDSHK